MSKDIDILLRETANELRAVQIARTRYASQLSPQFNCFNYITPDEMGLSRIIRDLLDPRGSHAQGALFLRAFLRLLDNKNNEKEKEHWADNEPIFAGVEVPTHHIDRQSRRLDIEIRWTDRALVIENKPWAIDQVDQLKDYIAELENRRLTEWHLVYLAGTHDAPAKWSIDETELKKRLTSGALSIHHYDDLIVNWLTECIAICKAERFRWFIDEFRKHILLTFKGERDMQERQAVLDKILESDGSLQAALEISSAIIDVRKGLVSLLKGQIKTALEEENKSRNEKWTLVWDVDYWKKWTGFSFLYFSEGEQAYKLAFEFERTQCDDFAFGIKKVHDDNDEIPAILQQDIANIIQEVFPGTVLIKSNHIWACWGYPSEEMRYWSMSTIPWVRIRHKELGRYFVELAMKVFDAFSESGSLNLLKKTRATPSSMTTDPE